MGLFERDWSDAEKWGMGLVSAVILAAGAALYNSLGGEVTADVASKRDLDGRCVDVEVLLRNETRADALDIEVAFDVDLFTRDGSVALEYGDERDQLIPPGHQSLIPRLPYIPLPYKMDHARSLLQVPRLKPGQFIHLYFGGESPIDATRAEARDKLLAAGADPALMVKPRVASVSRKDGSVTLRRVVDCTKT